MNNFKASNNTGDNWLICWTGQDDNGVHWNVTTDEVHASQLHKFSKGAEEDAKLIASLLDKHYSSTAVEANGNAYETLKARYDAGEPLSDLEILVLTYGGETEAAELERLQEISEDEQESRKLFARIMNETCPSDEVHCTCVPLLREKVIELQNALDKVNRGGL